MNPEDDQRFEHLVKSKFSEIDTDNSGSIRRVELGNFLSTSGKTESEANQTMSVGDKDGDGEITLEEFLDLYRHPFLSYIFLPPATPHVFDFS